MHQEGRQRQDRALKSHILCPERRACLEATVRRPTGQDLDGRDCRAKPVLLPAFAIAAPTIKVCLSHGLRHDRSSLPRSELTMGVAGPSRAVRPRRDAVSAGPAAITDGRRTRHAGAGRAREGLPAPARPSRLSRRPGASASGRQAASSQATQLAAAAAGVRPARCRGREARCGMDDESPAEVLAVLSGRRARRAPGAARSARRPAGVLSDYPAEAKLQALGLAGRFSPVLCATDPEIGAFKPNPRGFLHACAVWNLPPARCCSSATARTSMPRAPRPPACRA